MEIIDELKRVIKVEAEAVDKLGDQIDESFEKAVKIIFESRGKVVVTGVGKSGHIGEKFAATLASTGTPAFFVHSIEGVHGDLGMIQEEDVVILISNSGETQEVMNLLPTLRRIGSKKIVITSKRNSTLAKNADVTLLYSYSNEADHLKLAPTTSSTLTLVIGDALASSLSKLKKFDADDFRLYHPGGNLGKQLSNK